MEEKFIKFLKALNEFIAKTLEDELQVILNCFDDDCVECDACQG